MIDQILPHSRIGEHHFDHDDTNHQISEVQHHHIDNRCNGVGEGMLADDFQHPKPFQLGGLDIGRLHHVQDSGAGHTHHMRQDDQRKNHHRNSDGIELFTKAHAVVDDRDRRKQPPLDRDPIDQNIADHEFRDRDSRQRHR